MDVYLVRHGEAASAWGKSSDPGLSELGREQASTTASALSAELSGEVSLISSPLLRAQETAQALSELMSLPVTIDDTYREVPSKATLDERKAWLSEFMAGQWDEQPNYLLQWRQSLYDELAALSGVAVVFSHFLAINAVVSQLTGRQETVCFYPDNASVTHLRNNGGQLELISLGQQMRTVVN